MIFIIQIHPVSDPQELLDDKCILPAKFFTLFPSYINKDFKGILIAVIYNTVGNQRAHHMPEQGKAFPRPVQREHSL